MPVVLIDNEAVAKKIHRSPAYLKRFRRSLEEKHNFPPYTMRGLTDEAKVEEWLANGGMNQRRPPAPQLDRGGRPRDGDAEARQRQANRNLERLKRPKAAP